MNDLLIAAAFLLVQIWALAHYAEKLRKSIEDDSSRTRKILNKLDEQIHNSKRETRSEIQKVSLDLHLEMKQNQATHEEILCVKAVKETERHAQTIGMLKVLCDVIATSQEHMLETIRAKSKKKSTPEEKRAFKRRYATVAQVADSDLEITQEIECPSA